MKAPAKLFLLIAVFVTSLSRLPAEPSSAALYEQELNKISTDLSSSLKSVHVKTVSMPTFTDLNGGETDLGEMLTEDLTVDLVNQNEDISVIDRSHQDQSDNEQDSTTNKIDAIIVGTIIPLGTSYRIEVKIMAPDSGKLLAAKRFSITRTDELDALMGISKSDDTASQNPNAAPFPGHAPFPKAGLTLWLKADAGIKTDSNRRVIQWRDQSGLGNDAAQPEPSSRPVLVPGGIHGKPVIQLDGSTYLSTKTVATTGQDYSVFLISTLGDIQHEGAFFNGARGHTGWGFDRYKNPQAYGIINQGTNWGIFGSVQNPDGFQLQSATRGSGITSFYAFGAFMGTDNLAMDIPTGAAYIGTMGPPFESNPYFSGKIAEIIVYDRKLTDAERQSVERYLATKYDLTLNSTSVDMEALDLGGSHK